VKWWPPHEADTAGMPEPGQDELARLTAKADLIMEELGLVVGDLGELLRRRHGES
jgi:hypothetical protein